ncbi:DUF3667 domain-containing protein [uncultured Psychroserpens sp.]|uniref:DUF3667 domain-containing protein n=1 Tax=uncultured Psychroserpens sp. TaxID=255436 RepID=UPI0026252E40|nr:DUF3667 domain-containing protein [uncultured Psychroserpens sp.]
MNCKNCHIELSAQSDFCNHCGGKVIRNRLTFKNLFEHISETFFNYDNKLLRTFIDLVKKPDAVIGSYIDGVRKRYVNPISFFGLTLTLVGLEWLILRKYFPEQLNLSSLAVGGNESTLNAIFSFVQDYSSLIMMLSVPIYALISRIVFFDNKKYNYVEHIVTFTYMMAFLSLLGAVINIIGVSFGGDLGLITYINLPMQIIYISYCFKKLYKISFAEIFGRMILSFFIYIILYVCVVAIILLGVYLIEGKESLMSILNDMRPQ